MAVTTNRRNDNGQKPSATSVPPPLSNVVHAASLPRRRRPALLAGGVVLAILGALSSLWLVNATAQRRPVLVMARTVAMGSTVSAADLAVTEVSSDPGVSTVAAARRGELLGQVARTELVAGSLLAAGSSSTCCAASEWPGTRGPRAPAVADARAGRAGHPHPRRGHPPDGCRPRHLLGAGHDRRDRRPVGTADLNGLTPVDVTVPAGDGPALAARAGTVVAVVVRPTGQK